MKRRSFLSALAALPFLPKLLRKQEALTGESAEPKFVPQATRVSPRRRYYNPDDMPSTSGTYSDAVTYYSKIDCSPPRLEVALTAAKRIEAGDFCKIMRGDHRATPDLGIWQDDDAYAIALDSLDAGQCGRFHIRGNPMQSSLWDEA